MEGGGGAAAGKTGRGTDIAVSLYNADAVYVSKGVCVCFWSVC